MLVSATGVVVALGACSNVAASHLPSTTRQGPSVTSPTTSPTTSPSTSPLTDPSPTSTTSSTIAKTSLNTNQTDNELTGLQTLLGYTNTDFIAGQKENASGTASASLACKAATLRSARRLLEQELSTRATQLQYLAKRISGTKDIAAADVTRLNKIVWAEQTSTAGGGIKSLEPKVAKAPNCGALIADARIMVKDFWVYALVSPQVDLTAAASVESTIETQLISMEPKVNAAINAAIQRGTDESAAQATFSDLASRLGGAVSADKAISISTLLAQQPADFPGDLSMIGSYRNYMLTAAADLGDVSSDLRTILGDLA